MTQPIIDELTGTLYLTVKGFKSLVNESTIEVRPLTVLAGANSSGKSSIMQPFLLLKQTLEASYDPGPLRLDEPNVRFTDSKQFFSTDATEFYVQLATKSKSIKSVFEQDGAGSVVLCKTAYTDQEQTLELSLDLTPPSLLLKLQDFLIRSSFLKKKIANVSIFQDRSYLKFLVEVTLGEMIEGKLHHHLQELAELPTAILHIPGLRGTPKRVYELTPVRDRFSGTFERYTASVIHHWQTEQDERLDHLRGDLETLGLAWGIKTNRRDGVSIEVKIRPAPDSEHWFDIADMGFALSQVLPVLVALRVARPDQLVYIEQPELHLHPRAQVALAEVLADAAKRGVRTVIETHSSLLLLAIQTLVAEDRLDTSLTKLHWFSKENGITHITSADLDKFGTFGEWPSDFGDIELGLHSRYLDAVDARHGWLLE